MDNTQFILGIDTSNYCTSVAIIDNEFNIIKSLRKMLDVKKGSRGLRQSEAFFQHINNLPLLIQELSNEGCVDRISGIAVSVAPREVKGSYMPVFLAGENMAKVICLTRNIPLFRTYHQNGHLNAATLGTKLEGKDNIIGIHLSGGTTEVLLFQNDKIQIIGGTKDISIGQLIDRVGVKLGFDFPAGKLIDNILINANLSEINELVRKHNIEIPKKILLDNGLFNLSGCETFLIRLIDDLDQFEIENNKRNLIIAKILFDYVLDVINQLLDYITQNNKNIPIVLFGGVMESEYLREKIRNRANNKGYDVCFAEHGLSGDNAVGVAYIGGKKLWQESQ